MKTTPGPWVANGSEKTQSTWVYGPDNRRICTMTISDCDWGNAQLMSAAPDMYEALEMALKVIDNLGPCFTAEFIRAALKKANGL